jgi:hypothetical protein
MANKRTAREKVDKDNYDLLKPIDILTLGSDDDPCFGKLHDLLSKECKVCGDSEFCAIANAQYLKGKNLKMESNQRFKDIEEANKLLTENKHRAKDLIKKYKEKGLKKFKILIKVSEELNLTKDEVKQLI